MPDKKLKSSKQKLWASTGIVASILLCFLVVLSFGKDKVRQTMIRITAFRQVTHPETPSPLWGTVVKPFPTGAFWTNLVVKNGDLPIGVYPYGVKTTDAGVQVSYGASRRAVSHIHRQYLLEHREGLPITCAIRISMHRRSARWCWMSLINRWSSDLKRKCQK